VDVGNVRRLWVLSLSPGRAPPASLQKLLLCTVLLLPLSSISSWMMYLRAPHFLAALAADALNSISVRGEWTQVRRTGGGVAKSSSPTGDLM